MSGDAAIWSDDESWGFDARVGLEVDDILSLLMGTQFKKNMIYRYGKLLYYLRS